MQNGLVEKLYRHLFLLASLHICYLLFQMFDLVFICTLVFININHHFLQLFDLVLHLLDVTALSHNLFICLTVLLYNYVVNHLKFSQAFSIHLFGPLELQQLDFSHDLLEYMHRLH